MTCRFVIGCRRRGRLAATNTVVETDPATTTLAVDLGERHIVAGVMSASGDAVVGDRIVTPRRDTMRALGALVERVMAAAPVDQRPVVGAVTAPGPVDPLPGEFRPLGLRRWWHEPIRRVVAAASGLDIGLESVGRGFALAAYDAACADRADAVRAAGGDDPTPPDIGADPVALSPGMIGLYLGDQVDGGVVIAGGDLLNGVNGQAGRFGHLCVDPDGLSCVCGAVGCLESYASIRGVEVQTDRSITVTPAVYAERAGTMVGRACAGLLATFDQQQVVIGGPLVRALGEPFLAGLRTEFERRCRLPHLGAAKVRIASLSALAPAGAVGQRLATRMVAGPTSG